MPHPYYIHKGWFCQPPLKQITNNAVCLFEGRRQLFLYFYLENRFLDFITAKLYAGLVSIIGGKKGKTALFKRNLGAFTALRLEKFNVGLISRGVSRL